MEKDRKQKFIVMIALMIAIASMSLGFAAFSTTLNISSSASVTPDDNGFNIVFSSSEYAITTRDDGGTVVSGIGTNGAQGGITSLYRKQASGLITQFTEPGQFLYILIYAHNIGEYDAYLTGVNITNINGTSYKKCMAREGTTDRLVQAACDGIDVSVTINDEYYYFGRQISGHLLEKGSVEPIEIIVSYDVNATRADGVFDIEFGEISLEYKTIDSQIKVINFTVNGITIKAEEGITFEDWIYSDYAYHDISSKMEIGGGLYALCFTDNPVALNRITTVIQDNGNYNMGLMCQ